jgi:hypothetical protein
VINRFIERADVIATFASNGQLHQRVRPETVRSAGSALSARRTLRYHLDVNARRLRESEIRGVIDSHLAAARRVTA